MIPSGVFPRECDPEASGKTEHCDQCGRDVPEEKWEMHQRWHKGQETKTKKKKKRKVQGT